MKHGGDTLTYQQYYNGKIIDFSSNINPLGPPKGLKEALMERFEDVAAYPDIQYRTLKKEISRYLGCDSNEVVVGNGAVDIIHNMAMMFSRILVAVPCFCEYIDRPMLLGKKVVKIAPPRFLDSTLEAGPIIEQMREGDLIILGNPNNPTGRRIPQGVLEAIHEAAVQKDAFLLLDEAFYEFCPEDYDTIDLLRNSENICVVRAATKFFALPGIRLGYAYMSWENVQKYNRYALPWSVNIFADAAGSMIFKQKDYIQETKSYIKNQRMYLQEELGKVQGIHRFETDCNFILLKLGGSTDQELFDFMVKKGILIRRASNFEGLDSHYVRVAVKDRQSNAYLIACMKEYMAFAKECAR